MVRRVIRIDETRVRLSLGPQNFMNQNNQVLPNQDAKMPTTDVRKYIKKKYFKLLVVVFTIFVIVEMLIVKFVVMILSQPNVVESVSI